MPWLDLQAEVSAVFAEYSWRADDYQSALETRSAQIGEADRERRRSPWLLAKQREYQRERYHGSAYVRQRAVQAMAEWRKSNPERAREMSREQYLRDKQRAKDDPAYAAKRRGQRRAAKARYRDKHREHMREVWRRNAAAYRERKRTENAQRRADARRAA